MEQIGKYMQKLQITYIKEWAKSSNIEIDDFFTLSQLIFYAQAGGSRS
jgi:hypothetical protein